MTIIESLEYAMRSVSVPAVRRGQAEGVAKSFEHSCGPIRIMVLSTADLSAVELNIIAGGGQDAALRDAFARALTVR
jgi:hypothetical protein